MLHRMTDLELNAALHANEQLRMALDDSPTNPLAQRGVFRDLERDDREALTSVRLRLRRRAEDMQTEQARRVRLAREQADARASA